MQFLIIIASWLVSLSSVWLAWYLGARSRRSEGDRSALGRALAALLLIRHRLSRAAKGKQLVEKMAASDMPAEVDVTLKFLLQFLFPEPKVSKDEYYSAVSYVAGIDPLLAVRLRLDAMRMDLNSLLEAAPTSQVPTEIVALIADATEARQLDYSILELARLHSRKVLKDVEFYLQEEETVEIPQNLEDLVARLKQQRTR